MVWGGRDRDGEGWRKGSEGWEVCPGGRVTEAWKGGEEVGVGEGKSRGGEGLGVRNM